MAIGMSEDSVFHVKKSNPAKIKESDSEVNSIQEKPLKWFKDRGYEVLLSTGLKPGVGSRGIWFSERLANSMSIRSLAKLVVIRVAGSWRLVWGQAGRLRSGSRWRSLWLWWLLAVGDWLIFTMV